MKPPPSLGRWPAREREETCARSERRHQARGGQHYTVCHRVANEGTAGGPTAREPPPTHRPHVCVHRLQRVARGARGGRSHSLSAATTLGTTGSIDRVAPSRIKWALGGATARQTPPRLPRGYPEATPRLPRGYREPRRLRIDAWSERRHETRGESPMSLVAPVTHHDRDRRLCSPKKEMAVSPRNQNAAVGGDHRADARSGRRQGAWGGISRGRKGRVIHQHPPVAPRAETAP